jgi:hypothetical protein
MYRIYEKRKWGEERLEILVPTDYPDFQTPAEFVKWALNPANSDKVKTGEYFPVCFGRGGKRKPIHIARQEVLKIG